MEKIVFIINGKGFDRAAIDFCVFIAELTKSTLTGAFLHPQDFEMSMRKHQLHNVAGTAIKEDENIARTGNLSENKRAFALACSDKCIEWSINENALTGLADIIEQTRFADLLIVSGDASASNQPSASPTELVRQILSRSECPVIVAPISFDGITETVFAYDGSESSMQAIKEFTYLLPQLSKTKVTCLQIVNNLSDGLKEYTKLTDFLYTHYDKAERHVLYGRAADELFAYFLGKDKLLVVMGAYGRSALSNALHESTAELLLKTTTLPVFISHK